MDIGLAEIDRWHRSRGWLKIGYHYVIRRNGQLELGRHTDEVGAHAKGHNATSIGICMVGGIDSDGKPENNFTQEQWDRLIMLLSALHNDYPAAKVIGHNEVSSKDCPSFDVQVWLIRNGLERMAKSLIEDDNCPTCGHPLR